MKNDALTVWQINLHHSRKATDNLVAEVANSKSLPLILAQEPYLYKEKIKLKLPNYILYSVGKNNRSLIAIPKQFQSFFLNTLSDRDTTVILLEEKDSNEKFILASAYLDILDGKVISKGLEKLAKYSLENRIPMVIGMDSNAHSSIWGCETDNKRGEVLEEWILQNSLTVANTGSVPTFVTARAATIIDLTLVSDTFAQKVTEWKVNKEYQFSDHRRLEFNLKCTSDNIVFTRNFRSANWSRFQPILEANPRWSPPCEWTKQILDQEVSIFLDKIIKAMNIICPLRKINFNKRMTWWNSELQSLKHKTKRLYRKFRNNVCDSNHEQFKKARKVFYDAISKAKTQSWMKFCDSIKDIKSFSKVSRSLISGDKNSIGQLMKDDGTTTNDVQETLDTLMDVHFPGSSNWDRDDPQVKDSVSLSNNFIMNAGFLSYISIDKVKEAINSFSSFKAAGPDGCKPIVLQNLPESFLHRLTILFKASTALRYNPKEWCKSKVIFIPKLGKSGYDQPKSFRPISLTSFFFKTEEKVQKWEIEDKYLAVNPMHKYQFAFQKGKSTEAALSQVVDRIESGLYRNAFTLAVFLDISGAFDNICVESIIEGFKRKGIPEHITGWFESSLRNRVAETNLDGITIMRKLSKGTAQGGVISTIAFNLAIDKLLQELNKPPFLVVGFADDFCALINGICPSTLVRLMQPMLDQIVREGKSHGVNFNAAKTQVVMYTYKRVKNYEKLKINEVPLEYSNGAKYLGIYLDSKLSFTKHIDDKVNKCKKHLFALRNIIGSNWGPSPWLLKWSYTGIVRPKLTYACHIWQNKLNETKKLKLQRLNRLASLNIASVHRSTPTNGLEIIYNIPPLDLFVRRSSIHIFMRLAWQVNSSWDGLGHNKQNGHLFHGKKLMSELGIDNIPTDKIHRQNVWTKNFQILDFKKFRDSSSENNSWIYCYTDGSKINNLQSGCGFVIRQANKSVMTHHENIGTISTVFQAEVLAILRVCKALSKRINQKILIRSDSQSAIQSIKATSVESSLVLECIKELNKLGSKNRVHLQWIKAHCGHFGNEEADRLAKAGSEMSMQGPEPFLPVPDSYFKKITNTDLYAAWNSRWKKLKSCRQTKLFVKHCSNKTEKVLKEINRFDLGRLVQFITGHCNLNRHQSLQNREVNPRCRLCDDSDETPWHLVTGCPSLIWHRADFFHGLILYSIDWSPKQLLRFCKESSIWSMLDRQ